MDQFNFIKTETTLRDVCKLEVGSTFIFKDEHCTVTEMHDTYFVYKVQGPKANVRHVMNYWFYLKTPSATGRKLLQNVRYK